MNDPMSVAPELSYKVMVSSGHTFLAHTAAPYENLLRFYIQQEIDAEAVSSGNSVLVYTAASYDSKHTK